MRAAEIRWKCDVLQTAVSTNFILINPAHNYGGKRLSRHIDLLFLMIHGFGQTDAKLGVVFISIMFPSLMTY